MKVKSKNAASEKSAVDPRDLSLVVPIFRNEKNIPNLIAALEQLNSALKNNLEVVFVIDGSPDRAGELLIAAQESSGFRSVIAFHSRNFGAFVAIRSGLELARGKYIAVMAADLQEPLSLIARFFEILKAGRADIVFGQRTGRSDAFLRDMMSNAFWWLYRCLVIRDVPVGGVDIFGCSSAVRDVLVRFEESNSSLLAQLFWVGFRREFVPYRRSQRQLGESAWNFSRRFRYMMDSVFSFTDLPIMLILWLGILGSLSSIAFGVVVAVARMLGMIDVPGYTAIVLLVIFMGSTSLVVQGIIGAYLWRTFENTKRRPLRIISRVVGASLGENGSCRSAGGSIPENVHSRVLDNSAAHR